MSAILKVYERSIEIHYDWRPVLPIHFISDPFAPPELAPQVFVRPPSLRAIMK
jgi:hypothetical protein